MGIIAITATWDGLTEATATGYNLEYFWCRTVDIQKYLDSESTIQIGTGEGYFELVDAYRLENDVISDIIEYLSPAFEITVETRTRYLKMIASKLTASAIATTRFAGTMTGDIAEFVKRLRNEAWSSLQRSFLSGAITGVTAKDLTMKERLILYKNREQAVLPNV
jgi:hypothetical protein